MPVAHLIKNDVLMFKAQGEVTTDDFYRAWDTIQADPCLHLPIDLLVDLREAHVDLPGQEIEAIVYDLKRHRVFKKMVFVAERGSFTYAMGRMFCINAECAGCCSVIFLDMSEALAWLEDDSIKDGTSAPLPQGSNAS
jgi:hypothetical protein